MFWIALSMGLALLLALVVFVAVKEVRRAQALLGRTAIPIIRNPDVPENQHDAISDSPA